MELHKLEETRPNKARNVPKKGAQIGANISFQIVGRQPTVKLIWHKMNLLSDWCVLANLIYQDNDKDQDKSEIDH